MYFFVTGCASSFSSISCQTFYLYTGFYIWLSPAWHVNSLYTVNRFHCVFWLWSIFCAISFLHFAIPTDILSVSYIDLFFVCYVQEVHSVAMLDWSRLINWRTGINKNCRDCVQRWVWWTFYSVIFIDLF